MVLQADELSPKILDFRREASHSGLISTLTPGVSMFQRPVSLTPSRSISAGPGRSCQRIGTGESESMEQSVIGGAYGAAQLSLTRSAPVSIHDTGRQLPGYPDQVAWVQEANSRIYSSHLSSSHSDFGIKESSGIPGTSPSSTCSSMRPGRPRVQPGSSSL